MSEQSSRENFVEQNPQDAVKPWAASQPSDDQASTVPRQYTYPGAANQTEASIAVFRRAGFDGTAGCIPGGREPNRSAHSRDDGIPQISAPLAVRGAHRIHDSEPGDLRVGSI